jgi:uncharacterized protein (TIGR00369 family)
MGMVGFTDDEIRAFLDDPAKQPPCARHLGRELVDFSVDGGWAEVAFQPRAEFANRAGAVQGGFVCAMLDDAMSVAASISRRFAATVPTLQTTVSYLHPTPISRVIARGEVLRFGSSSVVMEGSLRTAAGKLLAVATATAIPRPFLPRRRVRRPRVHPVGQWWHHRNILGSAPPAPLPTGVLLLHGRTRERLADLEPLGLLKANDRAVLAAHCEAWSRSVAAGGPVPRRRRDQGQPGRRPHRQGPVW